jgi:hypothetical protein
MELIARPGLSSGAASEEKQKTIERFRDSFSTLLNLLQDSDMPPTGQMTEGVARAENEFKLFLKNK